MKQSLTSNPDPTDLCIIPPANSVVRSRLLYPQESELYTRFPYNHRTQGHGRGTDVEVAAQNAAVDHQELEQEGDGRMDRRSDTSYRLHLHLLGDSTPSNVADWISQTCSALSFNASKLSLNLYMSVPTHTVLPEHTDPYDVLICMHRGQKRFRVCQPWGDDGLHTSSTNQSSTEPQRWCREVLLKPGRCLFLRKGVVHQAKTLDAENGEKHVIHTTMGFTTMANRRLDTASFTCTSSSTNCQSNYYSSTGRYSGSSCGCDTSHDCDCGPWCCDHDRSCACDSCSGCSSCRSDCGKGRYRAGCGGRSSGSCTACSNAQAGFYYIDDGGLRNTCPVRVCPSCPVGQYRKGCSKTASSGVCALCTGLKTKHYFSGSGGHTEDSCPQRKCADTGKGRYSFLA